MLGALLSRLIRRVMEYMVTPRSKYAGLSVSRRWLNDYKKWNTSRVRFDGPAIRFPIKKDKG